MAWQETQNVSVLVVSIIKPDANTTRTVKTATNQVINQARILARQIIMTRQWVSDCGGIMVARDSYGAKDTPYFYDDQMKTARGVFQRFTPSMVTKKLSIYSMRV